MIQGIIPLSVMTSSLIVGSAGDALNDKSGSKFGHALKTAEIGILVMSPFVINLEPSFENIAGYAVVYTTLRIALFDVLYNAFKGNPVNYSGTKSWWDRIMKKVPGHGKWWIRGWCLALGVAVAILSL